jgi:hypothetical protein
LRHGHQFHACGFEPVGVGGEVRTVFGSGIGQLLQLLAGTGLAGAGMLLYLALGRCLAFGFVAGCHALQAVFPLDVAHDGFLPAVVVGIAHDFARMGDAVGQDVDVFVLGVGMPRYYVLVICEPHSAQISLAYGVPLVVC